MKNKIIIKKIFFISIIAIVALSGCVDYQDLCREKTKWIIVYNNYPDPYKLLIDDKFVDVVQPKDSIVYTIDYGYYNFKFIQESGYDSIPNMFEDNLNIDSCTRNTWEP